jgi:hypothetical protein
MKNSQIHDARGDGVLLFDQGSLMMERTILDGVQWPVRIYDPTVTLKSIAGNRYDRVKNHGIEVDFQDIEEGEVLTLAPHDRLPYYAEGLLIRKGGSLELEAGVVLKIAQGYRIDVSGALSSQGAEGMPVFITSGNDDTGGDTNGDGTQTMPQPGDWDTIHAVGDGTIDLALTRISYTGKDLHVHGSWRAAAVIAQEESTVVMKNTQIRDARGNGVIAFDASRISLQDVEFNNIQGEQVLNPDDSAVIDVR